MTRISGRMERIHWMSGGRQLLVTHADQLRPAERRAAPLPLLDQLDAWPGALKSLPPGLEWARDTLRTRQPVLERSQHDDRVYWGIRFPLFGDVDRLAAACFGSNGPRPDPALPDELRWLAATFGTVDLCSEWSGTSPWGLRLRDVSHRFFEGVLDHFPTGSGDWAVLYEADGDWVFIDLESGRVHWTGLEWTGEADVDLGIPWRRALGFVLWRLLDGGFVRPTDLAMLAP